jgi:outer membrane immunogenic protein
MRKFPLMALAAMSFVAGSTITRAADLGVLPPAAYPYGPVPHLGYVFYNWAGPYIGINGGGAWANVTGTSPPLSLTGAQNASGGIVGGTIGVNFQVTAAVFGVEGDFDYSSVGTNAINSHWLSTLRARAGYAWDRLWFYGTGGAAFANVSASFAGLSGSTTQIGWTAGAGVEWAFADHWTTKLEYLYVDLGTANLAPASIALKENLVRLGLNYKF